jgi:hypothetical protein
MSGSDRQREGDGSWENCPYVVNEAPESRQKEAAKCNFDSVDRIIGKY